MTESVANYTENLMNYVDKYEEKPLSPFALPSYQGRAVIGSDTPINKGVYLCATKEQGTIGEACVVDDDKPENIVLHKAYHQLIEKIYSQPADKRWNYALFFVQEITREFLPYDSKKVDDFTRGKNGTKISLASFMNLRFGVCRHQALLSGYLIERLIKDKHLQGSVSVDRNQSGEDGHAWCRYTSPSSRIYIVDVAQNLMAPLERTTPQHWDYARPYETVENGRVKTNHFGKLMFNFSRRFLGVRRKMLG